jgi:hypothetical protein
MIDRMAKDDQITTRRSTVDFNTDFIEQVTELFVAELECQLQPQSDVKIAEIEGTMREMLRKVGAHCVEVYLTQQDEVYPKSEIACPCGGMAAYRERRQAKILSVFGWVAYRRAYYLCSTCHKGQAPLDKRLGLDPGKVSAGLAPLLASAGVSTSFDRSSQQIERYLLLAVGENTVRKETHTFGQLQMAAEGEWIAESQDPELYRERHRTVKERPKRIYGTMDGAHAPLQTEWREMKVGAWFEVEPIPAEQVPAYRRAQVGETGALRAKNISYYCDIQKAKEFGALLWATGCQRNADLAEELVFVADGAAWIWNLVDFYYPKAVQIVDWHHAEEYLTTLAQTAFGEDAEQSIEWLEGACSDLWEGEVTQVIATCREFETHPQAGQAAHKAITYFSNNEKRMDYARFRQEGYVIGSGTVESGCKQIVTHRLKRSGARWSEEGARATGKARAAWLSGQWDHLSAKRGDLPLAV